MVNSLYQHKVTKDTNNLNQYHNRRSNNNNRRRVHNTFQVHSHIIPKSTKLTLRLINTINKHTTFQALPKGSKRNTSPIISKEVPKLTNRASQIAILLKIKAIRVLEPSRQAIISLLRQRKPNSTLATGVNPVILHTTRNIRHLPTSIFTGHIQEEILGTLLALAIVISHTIITRDVQTLKSVIRVLLPLIARIAFLTVCINILINDFYQTFIGELFLIAVVLMSHFVDDLLLLNQLEISNTSFAL